MLSRNEVKTMDNFKTLSVDNKAVKYAFINGRIIYSSLPDYTISSLSAEDIALSTAGIDDSLSGTYVPPSDTSAYTY